MKWTVERLEAHLATLDDAQRAEFLELIDASPPFADPEFPEQTAFVLDEARFLILFGTRRSGKSLGLGRRLLKTMWDHPGTTCLYLSLTKEEAARIMWRPVIQKLNDELGLEMVPNKGDSSWTMPNGSVLYLLGIDSSPEEAKKIYGQKFGGVAIDEAALYRIDIRALIESTIAPALMDELGWLCLAGMPSSYQVSLFFDLTQVWESGRIGEGDSISQDANNPGTWEIFDGKRITWKGHRWGAAQNWFMRRQYEEELSTAIAANPDIIYDQKFIQDMLGRWSVDPSLLLVKYSKEKNDIAELPKHSRWNKLLGIDLGFNDHSAFVVGFWRDEDPVLYLVEAEYGEQMDIDEVGQTIVRLETRYRGFDQKIVDGSNKQAVVTIRRRLGINLVTADKKEKWEHVQIYSGDYKAGFVKLLPATLPLKRELAKLVKDPNSDLPKPKPGLPDHCFDASLYVWRKCYSYLAREKPPPPLPPAYGTEEFAKMERDLRLRTNAASKQSMPEY